ncbi:cell division protein FtsL [Halothiobacillus diazotrophicus]|uniref:Cell division protein FtsL n=1 Tax=Halothiobacillus diazotrophicus TaxID=1860122 RepID=A0A191ZJB5_9GAMM|nr:cell division protein FtsL [Halothiobacillus diazotrophicus]ANJ67937.1 cell division protein FtsL [Halothiobacillus diazotrophicus]
MKFLVALLGFAVFASALVVVDLAQRDRDLTRSLSEQRQAIQKLNVTYAELQLEEGALAAQGRVDQIAQTRLDMHMPRPDQITMVFR